MPRTIRRGAALLFILISATCGPREEESVDTIPRETFVATYVDLRVEALNDTTSMLTAEERARILASHEITPEDLLRFVEVHGDRPRFMQEIWLEVEERIQRWQEEGSV